MNPQIAGMSLPEARAHFGARYGAIRMRFQAGDLTLGESERLIDEVIEEFARYLLARDQGLITTPGDEDEED